MKTCATNFRTHPWIDASTPPSNIVFEALQKRQLSLRVKNTIRDNAWDDLFHRDFGYCGKLSKDLRFLKASRLLEIGTISLQTSKFSNPGGLIVKIDDSSKTVLQNGGLQIRLQIQRHMHKKTNNFRWIRKISDPHTSK